MSDPDWFEQITGETWTPRPGDRVQVHNPHPYAIGTVLTDPFEKNGSPRVRVAFDAGTTASNDLVTPYECDTMIVLLSPLQARVPG